MEILRNNINASLSYLTTITFSAGMTAEIIDIDDDTIYDFPDITVVSGSASKAQIYLPVIFNEYDMSGYLELMNSSGDTIFESGVSTVRPYCDISSVATKLGISYANAVEYERLARYIIDTKTHGFYFTYKSKEITGEDTDTLLVNEKIYSLKKLYENEDLIYNSSSNTNEYTYMLNKRKSGIIRSPESDDENRLEYKKVWKNRYFNVEFPEGFDYIVEGEFGYKVVPHDIQYACELLMQDISCGNNRYVNKYIESFNTDGYDISYFKEVLYSTGNLIVDNILREYGNSIRPRVL